MRFGAFSIFALIPSGSACGRILYLGVGQYRGDLVVFNTTLEVPS